MKNDRSLAMVLLAVMILCGLLTPVIALAVVPERIIEKVISLPWTTIVPVLLPMAGAAVAAVWGFFTASVTAPKPQEVVPVRVVEEAPDSVHVADITPVDRPKHRRQEGSVVIDVLMFVVTVACAAVVAMAAPGCGTSALRTHATTALAAMEMTRVAETGYLAHLDAELTACGDDDACKRHASDAHLPAEAAIDIARIAVLEYRDGVELARIAEEGEDVMAALVAAAMRLVARWADVVSALATIGVTVPPLPIGGAS